MFDTHLLHKDRLANINSTFQNNNTVLHLSTLYNRYALTETLLYLGGDSECKNQNGRTPLHISVLQNNLEITDLLLSSGANIDCVDSNGYTPLMYATIHCYSVLIELLLTHNADISYRNIYNETCFDLIRDQSSYDIYCKYCPKEMMNKTYTYRMNTNSKYYHILNRKNNILDIIRKVNKCTDLVRNSGMFYNEMNEVNGLNEMYRLLPKRVKVTDFEMGKLLGKGGFGEVYMVHLKKTKNVYALKIIKKELIYKHNIKRYIENERKVYEKFHNPFIVTFYRAFQSNGFLYLLIEYMQHGDLKAYIKKYKRFNESEVKLISAQLILAIEHLHKQGIIYRDLKPGNILIDSEGYLKLADFGLCKEHIIDNYSAKSFCGSIAYIPPEILNREGHGRAADWYLLGTVMYELLTGEPPYFVKNNKEKLMDNITNAKLRFKVEDGVLSEDVMDLIRKLLERNISKRLGSSIRDSEEIKEHVFYKGINFDHIYNRKFIPPVQFKEPIIKKHHNDNNNIIIENINIEECKREDKNEWHSNEGDTVDRSRSHSGNKVSENEEEQSNFVEGWDFKGVFSKNDY